MDKGAREDGKVTRRATRTWMRGGAERSSPHVLQSVQAVLRLGRNGVAASAKSGWGLDEHETWDDGCVTPVAAWKSGVKPFAHRPAHPVKVLPLREWPKV